MSPAAASPLLFQKRCSVAVDSLLVTGLRVQLTVEKTLTKHPNTCEVKISNLSESTRRQMAKAGAKVVLSAGYDNTIERIFSGVARTTDHTHERAEWLTVVQCGDGETEFCFARVSESFQPGAKVSDIIESIATYLGVGKGNVSQQLADSSTLRGAIEQYAQGYVAHGNASTELDKVLKTAGFDWSIQDGELQVLKPGQPSKEAVVLLSPSTGLLGSPEHGAPNKHGKPSLLKCKSLLQPRFTCGGTVAIQSQSVSGQFRIDKLKHTGDTGGDGWYSELECSPL